MTDDTQQTIARIREHYAALGKPIDALSDEEIMQAATTLAQQIADASLNMQEAAAAIVDGLNRAFSPMLDTLASSHMAVTAMAPEWTAIWEEAKRLHDDTQQTDD